MLGKVQPEKQNQYNGGNQPTNQSIYLSSNFHLPIINIWIHYRELAYTIVKAGSAVRLSSYLVLALGGHGEDEKGR